jgi:hypothetical protein
MNIGSENNRDTYICTGIEKLGLPSKYLMTLFSLGLPVSFSMAPRLLEAFVNETNYVVWNKISSILAALSALLADEAFLPEFNQFVRRLFSVIRRQAAV